MMKIHLATKLANFSVSFFLHVTHLFTASQIRRSTSNKTEISRSMVNFFLEKYGKLFSLKHNNMYMDMTKKNKSIY